MRRLFGRERMVEQVQRRRLGTGFPALHLVQRHDQCGCLPHLLAQTLRRHPLCQRHPRRYREVQHPGFRSTPRHALAAYRRGALHPRLPALLRAEKLRRMSLRRLYGKPQRTAAVRTREHPYDRREDLPRLRRGLCPRPGAEPDGSVRPRGERRLPGAEGHGASGSQPRRSTTGRRSRATPATMRRSTSRTTPRVGTPQPRPPRP